MKYCDIINKYNLAGYDIFLSGVDLKSTYMILFDVDDFKSINDTYGHETGDKVLMKLVSVLKQKFRSDDYVCRIGGDEFVIFICDTALYESKNRDRHTYTFYSA